MEATQEQIISSDAIFAGQSDARLMLAIKPEDLQGQYTFAPSPVRLDYDSLYRAMTAVMEQASDPEAAKATGMRLATYLREIRTIGWTSPSLEHISILALMLKAKPMACAVVLNLNIKQAIIDIGGQELEDRIFTTVDANAAAAAQIPVNFTQFFVYPSMMAFGRIPPKRFYNWVAKNNNWNTSVVLVG